MVVVMDQAIYAKTIEISWKHQELFQDLVLRLGVFHTIGVLLAARLENIVIEPNVIAEG